MPVNRRNDNRLLHVQPDAPFEVVRAAYHALMARRHPDSSGDHEQAVLLNAAWAILGDATRRSEYDCGGANIDGAPVCACCAAPLTRPSPPRSPRASAATGERRTVPRVSRDDWGTLRLHWSGEPLDIRLRNLSLGGVSFYTGTPLTVGARVRVTAAAFDAEVEVVQCNRREGGLVKKCVNARQAAAFWVGDTAGISMPSA